MLSAPLGYKILFTFDMPDGSKNCGICTSFDAIGCILELYRNYNGQNLEIRDETFYKACDELPEET